MEDVKFLSCGYQGLQIEECNNAVNISGLKAKNCRGVRVAVWRVSGLNMINANVKNCQKGIQFWDSNNSKIQNCFVSGYDEVGILVHNSYVRYRRVCVEKKGDISIDIYVEDDSEFIEIF